MLPGPCRSCAVAPAFEEADLAVHRTPLPNSYPANTAAEATCLEKLPIAFGFLQSRLVAGQTVLIHCACGRDRTGLLLAYYLAREVGYTSQAAVARVREVCPKALSATGWEAMAERIIADLLSA